MSEPQVAAGQVLGGRYVLGAEIGRGGMATVYRALDRKHDRPVAVKILSPDLSPLLGPDRFTREIRIAASLQHPNIVPLYDSGDENGELYYVMPLIEGETLRARLGRETQLPLADAVRIARDVLDALGHAHALGVVHRDIKPENILLTAEKAVVTDFGIAKAIDAAAGERITSSGLAVGTPPYMSPEQSGGEGVVDGRTDLYALACVLYEMVGGEPPFTGPTPQVILARQMHEAPRSLRVARPTVPPAFQAVVERGLAKVPADRFASAAEFTEALAAAERKPGWQVRLGPGKRIAAGGLVLAGLAVLTVVLTVRGRPLDVNKVVVYPLVEVGGPTRGVGEQVALLIGSALEHTEPLNWIDGWSLMDPADRAAPEGAAARTARRLARARGARWFLEGAVVEAGDSLTVIVRLQDVAGDSTVGRASAAAPATTPAAELGLRAVAMLLPRLLAPGRRVDLSAIADRRPAAVALWLSSEQAYRASRYRDALERSERALGEDSALAMAAIKGAQAATWLSRYDVAALLVAVALSRRATLSPRYRGLADGLAAYLAGDADSAVVRLRTVLAADSTWSEAWAALGEVYFHLLPDGPEAESSAERAFAEAHRLEPDFAAPIYHLAELVLRRGDPRRAEALTRAFEAAGADSAQLAKLDLAITCLLRGPQAVDWVREARDRPAVALAAGRLFATRAANPGCAEPGLRAVALRAGAPDNLRAGAAFILQSLLVARGDTAGAAAIIDTVVATGVPWAMGLFIVDAAAGQGMDTRAEAVVRSLAGEYRGMSGVRLWYHAQWQVHRGDTTALRAILAALAANVVSGRDAESAPVASATRAHLALLSGDTTTALARLQAIRPAGGVVGLEWGLWEPMARERLTRAELLLALGRADESIRVASAFDQPVALHLVYLRQSLELRIRAADRLSRQDLAALLRRRLQALREGRPAA